MVAPLRITAERHERKFVIQRGRLKRFAAAMDSMFSRHRFTGDGANRLPGAHHFVTTIYFDTPARDVFQRPDIKVRAKEYYDLHPGLTESATDPRQLVRFQPTLWLERKARDHGSSGKQRRC